MNRTNYLRTLHVRITKLFPKTEICNSCKKVPPLDLANISQEYKEDLCDWEWLCRKCHMVKDGRINNLKTKHKLTREQIKEIRSMYKSKVWGSGSVVLARKYGIAKSTVIDILKYKYWK